MEEIQYIYKYRAWVIGVEELPKYLMLDPDLTL
jgi:hypothetical protein